MSFESRIEYLGTHQVLEDRKSARIHSAKQIQKLTRSINRFGFINPIIVDSRNSIICGGARLMAAKKLGLNRVPVIRADHLSEQEIRAYRLADDRIAEDGQWDKNLLRVELNEILEIDENFDLTLSGFDTVEIDNLLVLEDCSQTEGQDSVPEVNSAPRIARQGDFWWVGDHRVFCGDARDINAITTALNGDAPQLTVIDPPYNVPIGGHVSGLGQNKHDNFAMACGEMDRETYVLFLKDSLAALSKVSPEGSLHFVFMDWRHIRDLIEAGEAIFDAFKNLVVWRKSNAGMGAFYRSQHELIAVFKKGTAPHVNNFGLGQDGRYRTNVWDYAGCTSLGRERDEALAIHPTVKPVAMISDLIRDCTNRGDLVLDTFAGSGTTLLAAEQTGRTAVLAEYDPAYVDVILQRAHSAVGVEPIHDETGLTLNEIHALRDNESAS
ncbi:DNA methyltransferase [Parvibaculum sp.]|uniref:site-specific DNA-methyltransferase n=1 Tax=Parvibaculum sp. TaxID=2024848 RepID=UPI001B1F0C7E|nr:DNA methyltransferase [Parvibaculum sp.]MBO6666462.1 ParB N-terminal domain-containing protein [Parvibaculum sp.]MBO6690943.1 ParB N-terminal domain-containing protein [Parvibaculum sp.]MBO6713083.1 ParB N-terminal domain-containing protein [Parvibaculum sp.]